jgi:DUF1365 family protein
MFCFDIDQAETTLSQHRGISYEKFNWFSFHRKNYLTPSELALGEQARQLIKAKHGHTPSGKIYLLTNLSCLGYSINPISLYFVYNDAGDELDYLIVEVTNTPWGEKHQYVLTNPVKPQKDIYHYRFEKLLHVSPFLPMNYIYDFHLKVKKEQIILHINNFMGEDKHFDATLTLNEHPIHKKTWQHIVFGFPFMTFKVAAAIYWQALKLWIKGARFYSHTKKTG